MRRGRSSCHNHTTFCDGKNTAREMVQAALEQGFTDIGFSGHVDPFIKMDEQGYLDELRLLKKEYAGWIAIATGAELDYEARPQLKGRYDYILGSVHYLRDGQGRLCQVDCAPGQIERNIARMGGAKAFYTAYYTALANYAAQEKPQVIGHFDLVCKNNAGNRIFDETASHYRRTALEALAACVEAGCIVELNTGGMFRGYRARPYPAMFLLRHLAAWGGRVTVNADAHETAALHYRFGWARELLQRAGFTHLWVLRGGHFVREPLAESS